MSVLTEEECIMDWSKQAEEAVRNWQELQKRVWESWLAPLQGTAAASGPKATDAYREALEVWEDAVKRSLQAQLDWTRLWAESLNAAKASADPAASVARGTQEMMSAWTKAHRQLWESWLSTLKRLDPTASAGGKLWEEEARRVLAAWEEGIEAAQRSIAEWSRSRGATP
jgi:hypothetical protein